MRDFKQGAAAVMGWVLFIVIASRLVLGAFDGFEPRTEWDRARDAEGVYWPVMILLLAGLAGAVLYVAILVRDTMKLDRELAELRRNIRRMLAETTTPERKE